MSLPPLVAESQRIAQLRQALLRLRHQGASEDELWVVQQEYTKAVDDYQRKLPKVTRPAASVQQSFAACMHQRTPLNSIVKVQCASCGGALKVGYQAFECAIHGRCLPRYKPHGEWVEKWHERKPESDLYHLCGAGFCSQFAPHPGWAEDRPVTETPQVWKVRDLVENGQVNLEPPLSGP